MSVDDMTSYIYIYIYKTLKIVLKNIVELIISVKLQDTRSASKKQLS